MIEAGQTLWYPGIPMKVEVLEVRGAIVRLQGDEAAGTWWADADFLSRCEPYTGQAEEIVARAAERRRLDAEWQAAQEVTA